MRSALLLAAALAAPLAARAADVAELERRLDALSQEVERLKLGEAAEPEAAAPAGQAPAATKVYRAAPRKVSLGGYGEMTIQDFAKRRQDGAASGKRDEADFLRAVLYAGYRFNEWILFNSELEFEHAATGKGRGEVSVEQAYVDFQLHDAFNARAGLLLVPVGLANGVHEPTAFHGVLRPAVERSLIPSTWRENGAGFFGRFGALSYESYALAGLQAVANSGVTGFRGSDGLRNGRSAGAKSFAEDSAWVTRLDASPWAGVSAGASLYLGEADHNLAAAAIPVTLWDFHGRLDWRGAELKALYAEATIGNPDAVNAAQGLALGSNAGAGHDLFGGYIEAAFNVLSLMPETSHYLAPFYRYERYDTQSGVPNGWRNDPANSRVEHTLGATYKPIPQVAVKLDYQWLRNQARTGVDQFNLGLAYVF